MSLMRFISGAHNKTPAVTIQVDSGSVSNAVFAPTSAAIYFNTDGSVTDDSASYSSTGWYVPNTTSIGSSYDIRAVLTAGVAPTSGTLNTWLNLGTTRLWYNDVTSAGSSRDSTLTFTIRDTATQTTQATGTIQLYAEYLQ